MSANDLINFREQTILKWPFSGHFEFEKFCDIYVTQRTKQKSWTINIEQLRTQNSESFIRLFNKYYTVR